jgi:hypothetical protein
VVGIQKGAVAMENSLVVPQKVKHKLGMVVHTYNLISSRDKGRKTESLRTAQKKLANHYLKNKI